jgi:hypothetical protein
MWACGCLLTLLWRIKESKSKIVIWITDILPSIRLISLSDIGNLQIQDDSGCPMDQP